MTTDARGVSIRDTWFNRLTGAQTLFVGLMKAAATDSDMKIDETDGDRVKGSCARTYPLPIVHVARPTGSKPWGYLLTLTIPNLRPGDFCDYWLINHGGRSDSQVHGIGDQNLRSVTLPFLQITAE